MRRVCTICARGGSKGVPNKNLALINNIPLIALSIFQARQANIFDAIAVSSDSDEILDVARKFGVQVISRPPELASDTAAKLPAIRHAVRSVESELGMEFDTCVDLDATSPLRSVEDILGAVKMLEEGAAPNLITGTPARRSPYFNLVEMNSAGSIELAKSLNPPPLRRQDVPRCFDMNASIYVWKREFLMTLERVIVSGTLLYEMPEERSLDIDSLFDLKMVRLIAEERDDLKGMV